MTARIVTVANSYVAMVSPRAHRAGLSLQDGLAALTGQANKSFDPKVVTALTNYLNNRKNKPEWFKYDKIGLIG